MGKIKHIGCKMDGCNSPHRSQGFCRKHYRLWIGEGKKRYEKVKSNLQLSNVLKEAVARYRLTEGYKESKKKSDKKYYSKNKKILLAYRRGKREKQRFGTARESVLWRDGNICALCTSTIDLVVHHKDGKGRNTTTPNNDPSNLVTLCRSCHMKIHSPTKELQMI